MLLLSVILINFVIAQPESIQVKQLFNNYIHQVSTGEVKKEIYSSDFSTILEEDKKIFKICLSQNCSIKSKSFRMKHNSNLWKVIASISDEKNRIIASRKGCYFILKKNNKFLMSNYIEDCHDR